jgi:hypothetical protein
MKFRVKIDKDDPEDLDYAEKGLHVFLSIDKAGEGISNKVKNNMRRLLRSIATKNKLDYTILRIGDNEEFIKGEKDIIGLVDEVLEGGRGHWGSFYYSHKDDTIIVYDPAGPHNKSFERDLRKYAKRVKTIGCGKCKMTEAAEKIRPGNIIRQPAAGNYKGIDTSYASQHQFCFAESLMFLEEYIKERKASSCKTTRESLIIVKKYMLELAKRINFRVPREFKYIWDPYNKKPVSIV